MIALLCGTLLLGSCDREAALHADPSGQVAALARVNGEAVSVAEVAARAHATGSTAKEALSQLVAERLLVQHAQAGGYGALPSVGRAVTQASVRALLAEEIERTIPVEDVAGRARRLEALLAEIARRAPIRFVDAGVQAALTAPFR